WALKDRTKRSPQAMRDIAEEMSLRGDRRQHKTLASPEASGQRRRLRTGWNCNGLAGFLQPLQLVLPCVQVLRPKHACGFEPAVVRGQRPVFALQLRAQQRGFGTGLQKYSMPRKIGRTRILNRDVDRGMRAQLRRNRAV